MSAEAPPPRYSDTPLPHYAYRPGRGDPHPTRDPDGHSYGEEAPDPVCTAADFGATEAWRFGVDLFNHGYYWEAHEAWEGIWRRLGRRSEAGRQVQGLIQLAVAMLKRELGQDRGARLLLADARERLQGAALPGIDTTALLEAATACVEGRRQAPPTIHLET